MGALLLPPGSFLCVPDACTLPQMKLRAATLSGQMQTITLAVRSHGPKFMACIAGVHPCDRRRPLSAYREAFPGIDFSSVAEVDDVLWKVSRPRILPMVVCLFLVDQGGQRPVETTSPSFLQQ